MLEDIVMDTVIYLFNVYFIVFFLLGQHEKLVDPQTFVYNV